MPKPFWFEGFASPNYTSIPDDFFDVLAPELTEAELRVLIYLMRRTYGFKRATDDVSLKQLVEGIRTRDGRTLDHGTGMSKSAVVRGLAGLETKGVIIAQRNASIERGNLPTTYALRMRETPVALEDPPGPAGEHPPGPPATQAPVLLEDPQHTVVQETGKQQRGEQTQERTRPAPPRFGEVSAEEWAAWCTAQEADWQAVRRLSSAVSDLTPRRPA